MKANKWVALSQRLYRWLLQLYPQGYRASYEVEMFHLFSDQCREAHKEQGNWGMLSLWLRTLVDLIVTVVREHFSDPRARVGLLEAAPNQPLPWKGVLLVLIPGLIFFISQIEQVISNNDWFFLAFHRAGYYLILPVLIVWALTRRFPVWGFIPLGLLYATVWDYVQRFPLHELPFIGYMFVRESVPMFGTQINIYDLKYLLMISATVIVLGMLIWHTTRRGQISRGAWLWLGLYGLLVALHIGAQAYNYLNWLTPEEFKTVLFQISLSYVYESLPFLLLVFIGLLFAHKHGGFSFLILLGYMLPAIVFGRYGDWSNYVPFYVVSLTVLVYRFVVALVAPLWLVRAASRSGRQRAAAIPVVVALITQIVLNIIVVFAITAMGSTASEPSLLEITLNIWRQLITSAGLGLAVALYLPKDKDATIVSPPAIVAAAE